MLKIKKFITVLLAVLFIICAFAGCGSKSEESATPTQAAESQAEGEVPELAKTWPEFKTPRKVRIVCFEGGWTGPVADKDFVTPEIFKRTNFQLLYEPLTISSADEFKQKLNLMVASREVPPLFLGGGDGYSQQIYDKMGEAGLIWDISEHIKEYKNIYELVKPELLTYAETSDGKAYYVPTQTGRGFDVLHGAVAGVYVREDFLKKLNMDYPETYDDFYLYLKRCKEEIKTVAGQEIIGFTCGENFHSIETLINGFFTIYQAFFRSVGFCFDRENNYKIVNEIYVSSPNLMRAAKYINKLYREGLVDREILTHKKVQFDEKISSGRVASVACTEWWTMATLSDNAKEIVPDLLFVTPPDLKDSTNGTPSRKLKWTYALSMPSVLTISKELDEATMKHFLALLDYLATEEGQLLVNWGIENKSYIRDSNGKIQFIEEFKNQTDSLDWNKVAAYGVYYWQQLVQNSMILGKYIDEYPELVREDNYKSWQNKKEWRDLFDPNMPITKDMVYESGEVQQQLMPAIEEAYIQFLVKVFLAKDEAEVEKVVNEWGETCKKLGIDRVIEEMEKRIQDIEVKF